jgi:uncharacterized protein
MDFVAKYSDLYVIPIVENYLVFAPRLSRAMMLNKSACKQLKSLLTDQTSSTPFLPELLELKEQIQDAQVDAPQIREGSIKPVFLGIIPTRSCNLSCVYCDFGSRTAKYDRIDSTMLVRTIDWFVETAQANKERYIEIHFFGGEPFIAQDVVEIAVHRARLLAAKKQMNVRFEAATNGIFNDDMLRFIIDYFDTIVLSIDGLSDIHDRNRPKRTGMGSYDHVIKTAEQLDKSLIELCFRTCITHESVHRMSEIADWFAKTFSPSVISFETLNTTSDLKNIGLVAPDPYEFSTNYIRAQRILNEVGVSTVYAAACIGDIRNSFCPIGQDALILSPDGRLSGCYLPQQSWRDRGLNLDIGTVGQDGNVNLDFQQIGQLRKPFWGKERCRDCFCRLTCAGGCHVNHTFPGSQEQYDNVCIQTRILTACNLLDKLELREIADSLVAEQEYMTKLAVKTSDRIEDYLNVT